jgi:glycolate oxidase FAD binding subunit
MIQEWQERIRAATAASTPLRLVGGGTKPWLMPEQGELLSTAEYSGIVDYEPSELVITARCGTPLTEVEALLEQEQQMLAFEPPRFGTASTWGGCIAAGLSGPRRATAGAVRDFVLGAQLLNGKGQLLNFGGRVMKNVAGYDISRALAGSCGVLGIITQASLKVLPKPRYECSLRFELDQTQALRCMNEWAGLPLPISATAWHEGSLTVRLSGAESALDAAQQRLGGELLGAEAAQQFWNSVRDQSHSFFQGAEKIWRFSLPSVAPVIPVAAECLLEWGGAQRWIKTEEPGERLVALALQNRGYARPLYCHEHWLAGLSAPVRVIHERLKAEFDPTNIFNRDPESVVA